MRPLVARLPLRRLTPLPRFVLWSLCFASIALLADWGVVSWLCLNETPSAPIGLYRRTSRAPARGELVVFPIPVEVRALVAERSYLPPLGRFLLKSLVALPGDYLCFRNGFELNGKVLSPVLRTDAHGRSLTPSPFCGIVPEGFGGVAAPAPISRSFDSRYFGVVPLASMTVVTPFITGSPADPKEDSHG